MSQSRLTSWSQLDLQDLFYAYRKAKADCFFERAVYAAEQFVDFEAALHDNLLRMLVALQEGSAKKLFERYQGSAAVAAKKLTRRPREDEQQSHGYFSDPQRAIEYMMKSNDLIPELRIVGDFPVQMHVLSALWINKIGHLYDALLPSTAYGSRLRRYRSESDGGTSEAGEYHLESLGSFEPYFIPYKKWQGGGLDAMRRELEAGHSVIAVSLDLKSYYHNIDPAFIALEGFQRQLGVELNSWERQFTSDIASAFCRWSSLASQRARDLIGHDEVSREAIPGGLPIGISAARVMANVLLAEWDRAVMRQLMPVFYGRYVDDIFLVMRDPGDITCSSELMDFLARRLPCLNTPESGSTIRTIGFGDGYQGNSKLMLQDGKHKVFFLAGRAGSDFLDSIESEIRAVSSERRLIPDPDHIEQTTAARVLSAAGTAAEEANSLRRADGLSVRRLGWSVQLRAVETLARDLPQEEWATERSRFYEFALQHILRPDQFLDQADYLPRLLSLAVALEDWVEALKLVSVSLDSISKLRHASSHSASERGRVNGVPVSGGMDALWAALVDRTQFACRDAVLRAYRWRKNGPVKLPSHGRKLLQALNLEVDRDALIARVKALREHDWAKVPYKDHIRRETESYRVAESGEESLQKLYAFSSDLIDFLEESVSDGTKAGAMRRLKSRRRSTGQESRMPFLFPTRPYSTEEIALFVPDCIAGRPGEPASRLFARFVRAVRGVWVRPHLVEDRTDSGLIGFKTERDGSGSGGTVTRGAVWAVGSPSASKSVRIAITSLEVSDTTWALAAAGTPDLGRARYRALGRLVNAAVTAYPKPHYLVLPELSVPERWLRTAVSRLKDANINLISGLDYEKRGTKKIRSEAVMLLSDNRLGFHSTVQIRQRKSLPAPAEEHSLLSKFGRTWDFEERPSQPKRIYVHKGFHFGVLLCSELQNMAHRERFQGRVDALFVLSWNRDLETFSSLVESAALDIHAYIALVNNRRYGDSRIRAPAKDVFHRDQCRVRGGKNDYLVVAEIDIEALRKFQSRALRWPSDTDPFKPVPEGFVIEATRWIIPD